MFQVSKKNVETLRQHATLEYPRECCGAIIGKKGGDPERDRVRKLTNIQDSLHRQDPEAYPRDARTAYYIEPEELLNLLKEIEETGLEIKAVYHSHPENPVYFSQEDIDKALLWGEPAWYYLIMSVYGGEVKDEAIFRWEPSFRSFVREEVNLRP